ncbi:MAG TPA: hypothetical protein VFB36_12640 [Nevskiaceae bacterium]|nr:hypothetical protein [Nevskiaceae bacterium]
MKKIALVSALLCLTFAAAAPAKDDRVKFSIESAMGTSDAHDKLDGSIKFYFGNQKHATPKEKFGTFTSNKKTNALGKNEEAGCQRAFLSAMIAFQERAHKEGGNAVINIKSVYKNEDFVSETEYECGSGAFVKGVALRGEVVKLP